MEVRWNIAQDETPGESSSRNHIRTVYYAQLREVINAASGLWCTTASASAAIDIERESAIELNCLADVDPTLVSGHATDTNGQSIRRSAPVVIMPLLYISTGARVSSFSTRGIGVIGLVCLIALSACATTARREAPLIAYRDAAPTGFSREVMYVNDGRDDSDRDAMRFLMRVREGAAGGPINVLALSGGGGGVAFGAGALVGWSRTGTRPEFQVVTGVSAGALLAPLAFLGPRWDATITDAFSGGQTQHLLQPRWILALFGASVYRGEPLIRLVDYYVTDELLRAVAAESGKGRLLLVATTDLDHERTVIWDMGRIAAEGGARGRGLFRDVLVASASIPGVFPPVLIRVEESGIEFDEMHVDGSTTAPFFIAPEIAGVLAGGFGELQGANVYVMVNGQLGGNPVTTPVRTVSIVKRGVNAALESSSRAAVEVALSVSNRSGMTLRVSHIPDDYPFTGLLDMRQVTMNALFEFGVRCATQKSLWGSAAHALAGGGQSNFTMPSRVPANCPAPSASPAAASGTATADDTQAAPVVASVGLGAISHP